MNGKTRTLEYNEALWIPDAMYERIKFELNLPSISRKYLEETTEDYGNKVTHQANLKTNSWESVIMPRLVYDIWPYYVPFYPLYSNLLYPKNLLANSILRQPIDTTPIRMNPTMSEPVYYRQIKLNKPAVEAQTVNKDLFDSNYISVEKLEEKIQKQIEKHQHLLSKSENFANGVQSNKSSSNFDHKSNENLNRSRSNKTIIHSHSPHESCDEIKNIYKNSGKYSEIEDEENEEIKSNKHYQFYKKLIKELYNDMNNDDYSKLSRSKSVTFSDESTHRHSSCYDNPDWTPYSNHHHNHHYHDNKNHHDEETDVKFAKKLNNKNRVVSSSKLFIPSRRHWRCFHK
jgi:hypothetical protein